MKVWSLLTRTAEEIPNPLVMVNVNEFSRLICGETDTILQVG